MYTAALHNSGPLGRILSNLAAHEHADAVKSHSRARVCLNRRRRVLLERRSALCEANAAEFRALRLVGEV